MRQTLLLRRKLKQRKHNSLCMLAELSVVGWQESFGGLCFVLKGCESMVHFSRVTRALFLPCTVLSRNLRTRIFLHGLVCCSEKLIQGFVCLTTEQTYSVLYKRSPCIPENTLNPGSNIVCTGDHYPY